MLGSALRSSSFYQTTEPKVNNLGNYPDLSNMLIVIDPSYFDEKRNRDDGTMTLMGFADNSGFSKQYKNSKVVKYASPNIVGHKILEINPKIILKNEETVEKSRSKYRVDFLNILKSMDYEFGYSSPAQDHFYLLYNQNKKMAVDLLKEIHKSALDEKNDQVIKNVLFILIDLPKEIREPLEYIAFLSMKNSSLEVQELCVRCFESWEEKKFISFLYEMLVNTEVKWLKEYIESVISDLKEA